MPRYYFHLRDGEEFAPDGEGQEFEDLDTAKHEAHECVRDIAVERVRHNQKLGRLCIEVADQTGTTLTRVTARELFD